MEYKFTDKITINPQPFLKNKKKNFVRVKLKWGMEYKGILESCDVYMNVHLKEVEEWINNDKIGFLNEVLIRCNNILYVADTSRVK